MDKIYGDFNMSNNDNDFKRRKPPIFTVDNLITYGILLISFGGMFAFWGKLLL